MLRLPAIAFFTLTALADSSVISLDGAWQFAVADNPASAAWQPIPVPHNLREIGEITPGSRRGLWYRRNFTAAWTPGQRAVIRVLNGSGVEIWLNGEQVAAAPPFSFWLDADVTARLRPGANLIALRAASPGIQGGVRLHILDPVHLELDAPMVDTPRWSGGPAQVRVRTAIENRGAPAKAEVSITVRDPAGKEIAASVARVTASGRTEVEALTSPIADPPLWSPETPRLSMVAVSLAVDGRVLERHEIPFGFRWFRFDPERGFTLNGAPRKLWGTVYPLTSPERFADRAALWRFESGLLKDMGLNFVRPTPAISDEFLAECDRVGLLATVRVHDFGDASRMAENMRRDVRQKFNHPSVIAWNFVSEGENAAGAEVHNAAARALRRHDPGRVVLVNELGWRSPGTVGLIEADVAGQGNYTGWYEGTLAHIGPYMDRYRDLLGERYGKPLPVIISNYGAASDPAVHTATPRRNDFSTQYFTEFHRQFIKEIASRPWVAGGLIFAWRDLEAEQAIPRHTWKGIVDRHERLKDAYYLYQSVLTSRPMVKIAQAAWNPRNHWPPRTAAEVEVFSNQPVVSLSHNGRPLVTRKRPERSTWNIVFREGVNVLEAKAGGATDTVRIDVRYREPAPEVPKDPRLQWRWVQSGWLMSSPAIADITGDGRPEILIGSYNGDVYALSNTGKPLWTFMTGDTVFSSPLVLAKPPMIVFTSSRAAYALSYAGKLLWKVDGVRTFDRNPKSPAAADLDGDGSPEIVVGSDTGELLLIDARGRVQWKYSTRGARTNGLCLTTPMIVDRKILFAADDGFTYVLSARGELLWKHDNAMRGAVPGQPPNSMWPSTDGKLIYNGAGTLKAHDLAGRVVWERKDLSGPTQVGPQGVTLFVRDTLTLVDRQGKDIGKFSLNDRRDFFSQPPVTADLDEDGRPDYIAGTRGTNLVAFSSEGKLMWKFATEDEISGSPAVADINGDGIVDVVFGSRDGYLYVVTAGRAPARALESREFRGGPERRASYVRD